jgi:hypothetical protein
LLSRLSCCRGCCLHGRFDHGTLIAGCSNGSLMTYDHSHIVAECDTASQGMDIESLHALFLATEAKRDLRKLAMPSDAVAARRVHRPSFWE